MDAFQSLLERFLPADVLADVSSQLTSLAAGDYVKILADSTIQSLLGIGESHESVDDPFVTGADWYIHVSRRLKSTLDQVVPETAEVKYRLLSKQALYLVAATAALQLFLQANVTGPPPMIPVESILFPASATIDDGKMALLRRRLIDDLAIDGEAAYRLIPFPELLCFAKAVAACPIITQNFKVAHWLKLRVTFVHQRLLSERSYRLQTEIYKDMGEVEHLLEEEHCYQSGALLSEFKIECAAIELHHGFDEKARKNLDSAARDRNFTFALTGLLGKRTKYQERDITQLVVLAKSKEFSDTDEARSNDEVDGTSNARASAAPTNLDLNDDTLLESISFKEDPKTSADFQDRSMLPETLTQLDVSNQPLLDPLDSTILLSLAASITNTSPADGLTREETLPYATRVLEGGSSNWQVYTQALLLRSRIEGYRSRTLERGLLQLQALVDQVIADTSPNAGASVADNSETKASSTFLPRAKQTEAAPAHERLRYIYQLCSPARWELEAELAARWVSLGGLRSALEIYERLEMWAEAALCWAATEREDKAKKIIRRQLFHSLSGADEGADADEDKWEGSPREPPPAEAPRLYCILGDIDKEPSFYEKAWEVSNKRYARAQRSLGKYYYSKQNYAKAASSYAKSLSVNKLNHQSWFALGCALLELAQYKRAAEAFARCVQLDDTDAEAYSNLAAAILRRGPDESSTEAPLNVSDLSDDREYLNQQIVADPQKHIRDALQALKRAAHLKHNDYRIWDNLLTVAASLSPPSYADIIVAQRRIIEMRGSTDGEKCVDAKILQLLVNGLIKSTTFSPEALITPGPLRLLLELVDKKIVPLITSSTTLWVIVAEIAIWRNKPSSALEAQEKAWRAVASQPGWENDDERKWTAVTLATLALVNAYIELGPRERTEGLAAGSGELVARDWNFKATSALRSIMGKGRGTWEGSDGWSKLESALEHLKSLR